MPPHVPSAILEALASPAPLLERFILSLFGVTSISLAPEGHVPQLPVPSEIFGGHAPNLHRTGWFGLFRIPASRPAMSAVTQFEYDNAFVPISSINAISDIFPNLLFLRLSIDNCEGASHTVSRLALKVLDVIYTTALTRFSDISRHRIYLLLQLPGTQDGGPTSAMAVGARSMLSLSSGRRLHPPCGKLRMKPAWIRSQ